MDSHDKRLVVWWAVLVGLTLASFEGSWLGDPALAIGLVIGIALFKVRIVFLRFMEVADAPWQLRAPLEVWVVALAAGILGFWYAAGA